MESVHTLKTILKHRLLRPSRGGIMLAATVFLGTLFSCTAQRKAVPDLADLDLVGAYHREPVDWTAERFGPHVSFVDENGKERWLSEGFLFQEAVDNKGGRIFCVSPSGRSADKASWERQLDLWLGADGAVAELDKACAAAAGRIGKPSRPRYVVITVPDPVMFEYFSDKSSSTDYWGAVDGRQLDFQDVNDQITAVKWYIDETRRRFDSLDCKYLELAGFYILSEELHLSFGETEIERLNHRYKRWETIIPAVAEYCHAAKEGLYWVPYHLAPGYKHWKELGFDMAAMQPNYYWDLKSPGAHPFDRTIEAIKEYGLGMEIEFEYSCVADIMKVEKKGPDGAGRLIFDESDVPALKDRLREYFTRMKASGLYGVAPIVIYSGSDALTQLATSSDPADHALYLELCHFIVESPLRHR